MNLNRDKKEGKEECLIGHFINGQQRNFMASKINKRGIFGWPQTFLRFRWMNINI